MEKQKKGTVGIYSDKGRLFVRLPRSLYGGCLIRRALNLADTKDNQVKALELKCRIEADINAGVFDPSLEKYLENPAALQETFLVGDTWSLPYLWAKYIEYKRLTGWSQTTYSNSGLVFLRRFQSLENQNLNQPGLIRDELIAEFSLNATKRSLVQIKACIDWAIKSGYLKDNKFSGMSKDIKLESCEEFDINPFSFVERDLIINAFETNQFAKRNKNFSHSQYADLVKFWFYTGCRTSELLGLVWTNIYPSYILFNQARCYTNTGKIDKKGLKTQSKRIFPINTQLKDIIDSLSQKKVDGCVFINCHGFPIHPGALITCWKRVLSGLNIEYRRPYQCRHTFITIALNKGMKVHDVARICGTSPQMIYQHYLGIVAESIIVPSI